MKRSEAINIISEKLNRIDSYFQDQSEKSTFAEEILKELESFGMVPPTYYPYSCGCSNSLHKSFL